MKWIMLMALLTGEVETKEFKTHAACKKAAHVWMQEHRKETAICVDEKGRVKL